MDFLSFFHQKREYIKKNSQLIDQKISQLQDIEDNHQKDPWGLNLKTLRRSLKILYPLYDGYFKVRTFGMENVPKDSPLIVTSNHSGQIPIDGVLLVMSFLMENDPPIILRGMAERFLFKLPFIGRFALESGTILGDRKNCRYLLSRGKSILVFPEGVKGISKSTSDFYQLQSFTLGFYRLALEKKAPILPVSVVGAEEFYPWVYHNKTLAKMLGVPALPLTPFFPLAGLAGLIPMPSPVDIHIGKPIYPNSELSPDAPNSEIEKEVLKIRETIQKKINSSLKSRRELFKS